MDRDDLAFAGLARHADLIAAGELSSRELVELFLARIARLDPLLNAFRVVLGEQALAQADQADGRRRAGDARPLLGVPIAIKDDIHVAGEVTAYGCDATRRASRPTPRSSRRLRAAGAVIIGKTHVPELMATRLHRVADVRRHPQPVGPAPHERRLQRRLGDRGRRRAGQRRARHRRRRLDPHPRRLLRAVRPQAAARADLDRAGRRPAPRHDRLRPADAHRRRRRALHGRRHRRRAVAHRGRRDRRPGRLRIAISVGLPPLGVSPDAEQLGGVHSTAALLRELGHEVVEREFDWGLTLGNRVLARFVRGLGDKAVEIGHRDRLSRRARGHRPDRDVDPAAASPRPRPRQSAADAAQLNRIFDESDVVLDPDVHPPAAARARVRRPRRPLDPGRQRALRALRRRLQPHRPARGGGARGLHGRRLPARRAARRPARQRGAADLARPPSSSRPATGPAHRPAVAA